MTIHRPSFDRAAELRTEDGVIERLRGESGTRVIAIGDGRARIVPAAVLESTGLARGGSEQTGAGPGTMLLRVAPDEVGDATWALLGRDADGSALLLAAVPPQRESFDAVPDETWLSLRDIGGRVDGSEAEILVEATALAGWLRDAPFCPTCGGGTELRQAGWSRRCLRCGREHFPRTDPAVIVAVESADGDRLLLGANANWGGRMYSCFAGFAEAGESLEATVHREIEEESGVRLSALRYVSSQAWPYPRSLMIGFRAVVEDESATRADGEEIIDVRWFTRAEIGSALEGAGPVGLPGPASIARALITSWYEEGRA